jgi:hypothetical protein
MFDISLDESQIKNGSCQGEKSLLSTPRKESPLNGHIVTTPAARTAIQKADRPYTYLFKVLHLEHRFVSCCGTGHLVKQTGNSIKVFKCSAG